MCWHTTGTLPSTSTVHKNKVRAVRRIFYLSFEIHRVQFSVDLFINNWFGLFIFGRNNLERAVIVLIHLGFTLIDFRHHYLNPLELFRFRAPVFGLNRSQSRVEMEYLFEFRLSKFLGAVGVVSPICKGA